MNILTKNKFFRWPIIVTIALIVFLVVGKSAGWFGKGDVIKVAAEKAAKRNIIETVTASGKVEPETEVKISPDVSGEIVELPVKVGDRVTKGQLLAKIKPDIYESLLERSDAAVSTAKANLLSAKARQDQAKSQLDKSQLNFDRNKKLFDQKMISSAEYENVQAALDAAKGEYEAAVQTVQASQDQVTNFTVLSRVIKESFNDLMSKDKSIKPVFFPGMSATVEIQTKRAKNVISVPIQAVTTRDTTAEKKAGDKNKKDRAEKNKEVEVSSSGEVSSAKLPDDEKDKNKVECVFVIEKGKAKLKAVKIGIQDLNFMQIDSGLTGTEEVVIAPYNALSRQLKDGSLVEVVKKEELFKGEEKK